MRSLIVGLGSMGKRRIRNLRTLKVEDVIGFDTRADRREEAARLYGITACDEFDNALRLRPDVMIISVPPDIHAFYVRRAIDASIPFFSEASVVADGMEEMINLMEQSQVLGVPSCTMRYFPGPRRIKKVLQEATIGQPLTWTYHSGQYLPDWHPWESLSEFYVSKRETGGCREIVAFELVWLTELFGSITEISCQKDKLSTFPADIDDIYQLLLCHRSGVRGQLTVDVLARPALRHIRIIATQGTAEWDDSRKLVRTYEASRGSWTEETVGVGTVAKGYVNPEEPYVEEMADFLRCVRQGTQPAYSFAEDLQILRLLAAAERSADQGVHTRLGTDPGQGDYT